MREYINPFSNIQIYVLELLLCQKEELVVNIIERNIEDRQAGFIYGLYGKTKSLKSGSKCICGEIMIRGIKIGVGPG